MAMGNNYKHLARRAGSRYHQLFFRGRSLRAETLFRQTVGSSPRSPEEVARDYDIPVEAVLEAIDYCIQNEALLRQEREQDLADLRMRGLVPSTPLSHDGAARP